MKLNLIQKAILLSLIPTTSAVAGGLDRSGQSIAAFFQAGNYAEVGVSVIDADVKGTSTVKGLEGEKISDMAKNYYFPTGALKFFWSNL